MEINFDVAFAENGSKSDISEDKWLLGWVEIVGGINGVPTAQQFNQFGYVFDRKANIAYSKANEAMAGLDNHSNDSTLHISATERENWNSKADKSYVDAQLEGKADKSEIPTSLPANGGNADTLDGKHASNFAIAKKITTQAEVDSILESGIYSVEDVATTFGLIKSAYYMMMVNCHRTDVNYNVEIAVPYIDGRQQGVYYRCCSSGIWGTWTNVADDGNATTVNGHSVNSDVPTNAKFTDTTYSPGTGISISGTTISNSGVRSIATGGSNGTISVNTNGTAANVAVKGLASAAYQAVQTAAGTVGLHRISSGSAAATTTNCPVGCWYGQYE